MAEPAGAVVVVQHGLEMVHLAQAQLVKDQMVVVV
jgi:hypothetical protein